MNFRMDDYGTIFWLTEKSLPVKSELENLLLEHDIIEINFENVTQITPSCAAMIFSPLVESLGVSEFKRRIIFNNIDEEVLHIIRYAVNSRIKFLKDSGKQIKK